MSTRGTNSTKRKGIENKENMLSGRRRNVEADLLLHTALNSAGTAFTHKQCIIHLLPILNLSWCVGISLHSHNYVLSPAIYSQWDAVDFL